MDGVQGLEHAPSSAEPSQPTPNRVVSGAEALLGLSTANGTPQEEEMIQLGNLYYYPSDLRPPSTPSPTDVAPAVPPADSSVQPYSSHEEVDVAKPITQGEGQHRTDSEIDEALRSDPDVLARLAVTPEEFSDARLNVCGFSRALFKVLEGLCPSSTLLRRAKVLATEPIDPANSARPACRSTGGGPAPALPPLPRST